MSVHPIYGPLVEERTTNGIRAWMVRGSEASLVGIIDGLRAGKTIGELRKQHPDAEYEDLMEIAIRYGIWGSL